MLMNWKGAKAKLPCFCCLNVLGVPPSEELPDGFVPLDSFDKPSFVAATNADWWSKADTLSAYQPVLGKTKFSQVEIAMGLNFNEKGLLWDKELRRHIRPMDIATYDSMHVMLVDGVAQSELVCCLMRLKALGDDWSDLRAIMSADWQFVRAHKGKANCLRSTFSTKREALFHKGGTFNPDASSILMIFPVFGHYLETVAKVKHGEDVKAAIDSFHACACCVALAKEGKSNADSAAGLNSAMLRHAELKRVAYPEETYRAKDHWRFHIGDQLARDGLILDCFAGERMNRSFKRCAHEVCSSVHDMGNFAFEASIIRRTMLDYFNALHQHTWKDSLDPPLVRSEELATMCNAKDCFLSNSMVVQGLPCAFNDIVLLNGCPYRVAGCASIAGAIAFIASELCFVRQETATASRWRASTSSVPILATREVKLRYATAWYTDGDAFVILSI